MAFLSIACSLFNIWADVQRVRGKSLEEIGSSHEVFHMFSICFA